MTLIPGRRPLQRLCRARRKIWQRLHRIRPIPPGCERIEEAGRIPFLGDCGVARNGRLLNSPCGIDDYRDSCPKIARQTNVLYPPSRAAIVGGTYNPWPSLRPTQAPFFGWRDLGLPKICDQATVVHLKYDITRADWVSECLNALVLAGQQTSLLLVSARLRQRGYDARVLSRLGARHVFTDRQILVRHTTVLFERRYLVRWAAGDAELFRKALHSTPQDFVRRSRSFLSRTDFPNPHDLSNRVYPSASLSDHVDSPGGHTLPTSQLSPEE
jgi:hypothetical protein